MFFNVCIITKNLMIYSLKIFLSRNSVLKRFERERFKGERKACVKSLDILKILKKDKSTSE